MSDAEIEQAMKDAQEYAGLDQIRRDAMEVCSQSQNLLARANQALKSAEKQMDKADKKQVKKDIGELQKIVSKVKLDKVTEEDVEKIRQAKIQLESSASKIPGMDFGH